MGGAVTTGALPVHEQPRLMDYGETPERTAAIAAMDLYSLARDALIAQYAFKAKLQQHPRKIQEMIAGRIGGLGETVEDLEAIDKDLDPANVSNFELNTFMMGVFKEMDARRPDQGPDLLDIFNSTRPASE